MVSKNTTAQELLFDMVGFKPHPEQWPPLRSKSNFNILTGGDQGGKSIVAAHYLLTRHLLPISNKCPRCDYTSSKLDDLNNHIHQRLHGGLYWLVAADYERTRQEFEYLVEALDLLGLVPKSQGAVSKRVDPGHILLTDGTRIETKSAKDPRTLAMKSPNGILGCEASQLDMEIFYRLMSRAAPRNGWVFLSGSLEKGAGWYPQISKQWMVDPDPNTASFRLPTPSNITLFPEGIDDPKIKDLQKSTSDEFFLERIMGEEVPPTGLVFPEFRPNIHVKDIAYVPDTPVHLWVDPGYAGAHAVEAVQIIDGQVRVFDELYEHLTTTDMIDLAMQQTWWKDVEFGVQDVAGQYHQGAQPPAHQVWLQRTKLYMQGKKIGINEGNERLKTFLKVDPVTDEPKIVWSPKCKGALSEFGLVPNPFDGQVRAYRWELSSDGSIVGKTPKDRYNHACRATAYGLVHNFGYVKVQSAGKIIVNRRTRGTPLHIR